MGLADLAGGVRVVDQVEHGLVNDFGVFSQARGRLGVALDVHGNGQVELFLSSSCANINAKFLKRVVGDLQGFEEDAREVLSGGTHEFQEH